MFFIVGFVFFLYYKGCILGVSYGAVGARRSGAERAASA